MIGSQSKTFTGNDFITGMAPTNSIGVGGEFFGPETATGTSAVNLLVKPGIIYGTATSVDKTGTLTGSIVASCWDPSQGSKQVFLSDNGKVFTWDGTSLTERRDSTGTYVMGTSDMVCYKGNLYMTSTTNCHQIPEATNYATSIDEVWWSATVAANGTFLTNNRHPLLVFENNLFIGDGYYLHRFDGSTSSKGFLTLPTGQNIVCMNIDPNSGRMLISVTEGDNGSNTLPILSKILVYDGYSNKPTRSVIVDEMVTAIYALGGIVFMAYGKNLGYWNGSGITFLREFKNVTNAQADLVYKAKISSYGRTLLVADKTYVLAFGDIVPGKKAFYPIIISGSGSQIKHLVSLGSGIVGIAPGTATFETVDLTSTATTTQCNFYTNKMLFGKRVRLKEVVVTFANAVATTVKFADLVLVTDVGTFTMSPLTNNTTGNAFELSSLPIDNIPPARSIQLQVQGVANINPGVQSITVHYDELE